MFFFSVSSFYSCGYNFYSWKFMKVNHTVSLLTTATMYTLLGTHVQVVVEADI